MKLKLNVQRMYSVVIRISTVLRLIFSLMYINAIIRSFINIYLCYVHSLFFIINFHTVYIYVKKDLRGIYLYIYFHYIFLILSCYKLFHLNVIL